MGEWEKSDKTIHFSDGVNWDAASHRQLWDWFHQPRLVELEGWMDSFNDKVAAHFQAAADKVDQALRAAGVHWEGAAADAMQAASTPLAEHALRAKEAATSSGVTTLSQVMYARNTAMAMPEPQPVPDQNIPLTASPGELFLLLKDVHDQEAAASEAESRARDLARSYDTAADDAVTSLPRFEPAPSATVSRTAPTDVLVVDDSQPRDTGPGPEPGDPGPGDPVRRGGQPSGPADGSEPGAADLGDPVQAGGSVAGSSSAQPGLPGDTTSGQSWTGSSGGTFPGTGTGDSTGVHTPRPTTAVPVTGLVAPGPGGGGQGPAAPRGVTGGGPGADGHGGPGTGVRGGPAGEGPVTTRTTGTPTARGGSGAGLAPIGVGRGQGDEDKERTSPEYLRDYHDDLWDDTPPVAPAVIGDDEPED